MNTNNLFNIKLPEHGFSTAKVTLRLGQVFLIIITVVMLTACGGGGSGSIGNPGNNRNDSESGDRRKPAPTPPTITINKIDMDKLFPDDYYSTLNMCKYSLMGNRWVAYALGCHPVPCFGQYSCFFLPIRLQIITMVLMVTYKSAPAFRLIYILRLNLVHKAYHLSMWLLTNQPNVNLRLAS